MDHDEILRQLLRHSAAAERIAELAYGYAQRPDVPLGRRRIFERVGIRAADLRLALSEAVRLAG